ncbi:MAG: YcaQ family DNA glycosylase [Candidatus Bathyarchaeota archaeon]|nr:MAG: YcaQ family DNA glycosylase [Candidatus Bathyarchaeota archaeon]
MEVSKDAVRRLMIEKQCLSHQPEIVGKEEILETIERLGCVQIDTINVVERAHYLTLWSRLGTYDKGFLHELAYTDREIFEYWAHAASYIPTKDYRYFLSPMKTRGEKLEEGYDWARANPEVLKLVLDRVRKEGPLAAKDFEHKRKGPSKGWWDWKPAKIALEALFGAGILLVSYRKNFQRFYDLGERVLPEGVDSTVPTEEERMRFLALRTIGCLGLTKAPNLRWYYLPWSVAMKRTSKQWQATLDELVDKGVAIRFTVEGERQPYYCLGEDANRMEDLEDGFEFEDVRFLTNFDNMLWDKNRVKELFGFEKKLEAYIPASERKYGYFNLPILYGDRLVGRIVPKMNRKKRALIIHSVWHEPWFKPDEIFEDSFSETLEDFARFNGADMIDIMEDKPRIG